jgi:hypothetical protein
MALLVLLCAGPAFGADKKIISPPGAGEHRDYRGREETGRDVELNTKGEFKCLMIIMRR